MSVLRNISESICSNSTVTAHGTVLSVKGTIILARLPQGSIGDVCLVETRDGKSIKTQIITFDQNNMILAPYQELTGIFPGANVFNTRQKSMVRIPKDPRGYIIDSLGNVLRKPDLDAANLNTQRTVEIPLINSAPPALSRKPIMKMLTTGIRSIDSLCPVGYGQRMGLLAGPGLGKSTLLGMIARNSDVDVSVIALVGERGREVNDFLEHALGEEGIKKAVLVVATSDQPALQRALAAQTATAIAEYFRSQGKRVLLLIDSLTRMVRAIRDISLAAGELPVRQGLTPTVFAELPKLLERAGNDNNGSITAFYTLLDNASSEDADPLTEEVKSLLDGHIVLNSGIAKMGIRPAIDYTRSLSRLVDKLVMPEFEDSRQQILKMIARLAKDKDILLLGGIPDPELQTCIEMESHLSEFLKQTMQENFELNLSLEAATVLCQNFWSIYQKRLNVAS